MANKKKQNNPIYTLSGYAKLYVKKGEPYGLMLSGNYEDENGNKHYVNLWKKIKYGNVKVTNSRTGNPALHLAMVEVQIINKDEEDPQEKKNAEPPKRPTLEEVDTTDEEATTPFYNSK